MGLAREAASGRRRLGEDRVDLLATPDELAEAELPARGRAPGDPGILRQLAPGIEGEHQPAAEAEQGDRPGRMDLIAGKLGVHVARRSEPERAVEREGAIQVLD